MTLICMKCGAEDYYISRDFADQVGIKKCKKCDCEMIDPKEYFNRVGKWR